MIIGDSENVTLFHEFLIDGDVLGPMGPLFHPLPLVD